MAVMFGEDQEGQWFTWKKDAKGNPIRFRVRSIPAEEVRRIRAKHGGMKAEALERKSVAQNLAFGEAIVRDRAAYALLDSENFDIAFGDEATADKFVRAGLPSAKVGTEVFMDGQWTEGLKDLVLTGAPKLAGWVSAKADERANLEAEEDAERDQDFR